MCLLCYVKRKKFNLQKSTFNDKDIPQLKLPSKHKRKNSNSIAPTGLKHLKPPPAPNSIKPNIPVPVSKNDSYAINVNPTKQLTPVNNRRLKFTQDVANVVTPKTHEWYKQTFKDEINDLDKTFDSPRTHTKANAMTFPKNPPNRRVKTKKEFNVNPRHHLSPNQKPNYNNNAFRERLNSWNK